MTHDRFGLSGSPQSDGTLNNVARIENNHYRQKYDELPEPVVFIPVATSTSGRINEEFLCLLFCVCVLLQLQKTYCGSNSEIIQSPE